MRKNGSPNARDPAHADWGGGLQQLLLREHFYDDRMLPGRPIEGSRDGAFSWQLYKDFHFAAVPSVPSMELLRSVPTSQRLADS